MPPDISKAGKLSLEAKRAKGELACAECRRLKLRCDKKIPCSSCIRRGCSPACPNGVLSGSHGSRYVLADSEQLYRKLIAMSERIRQLEDALQVATPGIEPHPLLSDELLAIKFNIDELRSEHHENEPAQPTELTTAVAALHDSLGTLTMNEEGSTRFIGPSGSSEIILMHEASRYRDPANGPGDQDNFLIDTWPFVYLPPSADKVQILNETLDHLPTKERISALCEAYFENVAFFYCIVDRQQLIEELIPSIYQRLHNHEDRMTVDPHELALLLIACALGAVADLTQEPTCAEGYAYFNAARTALSLKSSIASPTLATIQALFMMSAYIIITGPLSYLESAWMTFNHAKTLAVSMGLHRDPSRWNFGPRLERRRRQIFWQLFAFDNWQTLALGRPSVFPIHAIDCKFPDADGSIADDGAVSQSYWSWSYRFCLEALNKVAHRLSGSEPLKLSDVLELDRRVREFPIWPKSTDSLDSKMVSAEGPKNVMRRYTAAASPEFLLLYMHRPFFAKAIRDPSVDPLQTPYAACFLSAFRSSLMILKLSRRIFSLLPGVSTRCWFIWHHSLCAIIVISSVIAVRPNSTLAPVALAELGLAVEMVEKAGAYAESLRRILPIVLRLRSKAYKAYFQHREAPTGDGRHLIVASNGDTGASEFKEELAVLGGDARIYAVPTPAKSSRPSSQSASPTSVTHGHSGSTTSKEEHVYSDVPRHYSSHEGTPEQAPLPTLPSHASYASPQQPHYHIAESSALPPPPPISHRRHHSQHHQPYPPPQPMHHQPSPPQSQMYFSENINDLFNMSTPVHPAMQPSFFQNTSLADPNTCPQVAGVEPDAWTMFMSESVFPGGQPAMNSHYTWNGTAHPT